MNFHPSGTRIANRYEVAGRPLLGGIGLVYLCFDHKEQRPVALKTFKPAHLADPAACERRMAEGNAWIRLGQHPHIVRCHTVFEDSPQPEVYLVLELVAKEPGRHEASLRAWLTRSKPLPANQALLIALQIVRGLRHATDTIPGFVHGKLTPENVLVGADRLSNTPFQRVRVTDLGLCQGRRVEQVREKLVRNDSFFLSDESSRFTSMLGAPHYLAPELWEGAAEDVRADIYALGCILGEMLIDAVPVRGGAFPALRQAHQYGQALARVQAAPPATLELLAGCLAVAPDRRYQDWAAVETALVAAYSQLTGHPAPAAEPVDALDQAERVAAGWSASALGLVYLDQRNAQAALIQAEHACQVGQATGGRRLMAAGLSQVGRAHAQLGEHRQAVAPLAQALALCRELGDGEGEATNLRELAVAHLELGDSQDAIGYFEQIVAIHRASGARWRESAALNDLGDAWLKLGDVRHAVGCHEQALAIDRELGDRGREADSLSDLGIAYDHDGDVPQAIGYYEQALAINRELDDELGIAATAYNLARLRAWEGATPQAILLAQEAAQLYASLGRADQAQSAQQMAARLEEGGSIRRFGPTPAVMLYRFGPLIAAAVLAAHGGAAAHDKFEPIFDKLIQKGWQIADPIRRIWAGDRDETALTAGIDPNSALVVREILRRL
jgi:tetratricopeptide (TPR) repeat protein